MYWSRKQMIEASTIEVLTDLDLEFLIDIKPSFQDEINEIERT
jgi:hypothetical protein